MIGGTRLKILDAMAMQLPLVSYPMALEGIDARHEQHVLIGETAEDLSESAQRQFQLANT